MTDPVFLGRPLSLSDLADVARGFRAVAVAPEAREKVAASRRAVDAICAAGDSAKPVYGVNTGFGALAETRVAAKDLEALQRNLIRSHATGVGTDLGVAEVRGIMLLRAQVLALGHSGVRLEVLDLLVECINRRVHPRIPSQGSVGASGDLAPLAHLALVLIGEGECVEVDGRVVETSDKLKEVSLSPLTLAAKEGLALINGTQFMASLGVLAVLDAERLAQIADIAGALSIEALKGSTTPFDVRLHQARPHPGQQTVAANMRKLLADSEIAASHVDCGKVQDPYSLRCIPQVHGASRDALTFAHQVLLREINSVTDNPSVFLDGEETEILSGGNFHGQPLALALDLAALATAELANISERRVEQLVNPALSSGLTPFLAAGSGLHSGFMIAQVASASLVSENKVLCHPASVDSIPSSAGKEDHVSMGTVSARKLTEIVKNVRRCLAIELMVAAAGIDQRAPHRPALAVDAVQKVLRTLVAPMTEDRILYKDIAALDRLLHGAALIEAAEAVAGKIA
jgi:histidine ammonia-lyase